MKNSHFALIAAVTLVFGFLANTASASSPRLIGETYVIRVYIEDYDIDDGMLLDAFWLEDEETKDKNDLGRLKNILNFFMPTPVVELKLFNTGIYRVASDGHIAIKHYYDDGSVTYTKY